MLKMSFSDEGKFCKIIKRYETAEYYTCDQQVEEKKNIREMNKSGHRAIRMELKSNNELEKER